MESLLYDPFALTKFVAGRLGENHEKTSHHVHGYINGYVDNDTLKQSGPGLGHITTDQF